MKELQLKKGQSTNFLTYTIKNSENNDGLVLISSKGVHHGNYGIGTEENVMSAKKDALFYFMLDNKVFFDDSIIAYLNGRGGTYLEFFKLQRVLALLDIPLPPEITSGAANNNLIFFNNKPLAQNFKIN